MDADKYTSIIVAVHGIGDQTRNATVRSVVTRFARMERLAGAMTLVAPQPLGYFHSDVQDVIKVSPVNRLLDSSLPLSRLGFSEVYWADIPQLALDDGRTIDETKLWTRTVVSRLRAAYLNRRLVQERTHRGQSLDFTLIAEVLDEIIDVIGVLENLTFLAKKAGLFDFKLRVLLERYVGDVQIVTEFEAYRRIVLARFHDALESIHCRHPTALTHIVAHSEGTVVALLGLLLAMAGECWTLKGSGDKPVARRVPGRPAWLTNVRGIMTLGSPIDKHLCLWPELFEGFGVASSTPGPASTWDLTEAQRQLGSHSIKWRNYYDYGDPVGFKLDAVRKWFDEIGLSVFEFDERHDIGYARYILPYKAHNDYWVDARVFEHFLLDVIEPCTSDALAKSENRAPRPQSRALVVAVSPILPYLMCLLLLASGTILLHRSVVMYTHPVPSPLQSYVRYSLFGTSAPAQGGTQQILVEGLGMALLLAGTTLFARWPRLARGLRWWAYGGVAFVLGCLGYLWLVQPETRAEVGGLFSQLPYPRVLDAACEHWPRVANCRGEPSGLAETFYVWLLLLAVALIGMSTRIPPIKNAGTTGSERKRHSWSPELLSQKRRARWFSQRMRPLILAGSVAVAVLVGYQLTHPPPVLTLSERQALEARFSGRRGFGPDRTLPRPLPDGPSLTVPSPVASTNDIVIKGDRPKAVEALLSTRSSTWPVLVSAAAFLYLWWLAALMFDLSFVWERYIRQSVMHDALRRWRFPEGAQRELRSRSSNSRV